jgi:hypothetical protein
MYSGFLSAFANTGMACLKRLAIAFAAVLAASGLPSPCRSAAGRTKAGVCR